MVSDSTTDSQLFRGSPITSDVFKKRKASLLRKLKHCKVDGASRSRWTQQYLFGMMLGEEEDDNSSDDYSDALSMVEEEDPSESDNESTSTAEPEEKATDDQKKDDDDCPLCAEKMDATDLLFKPCSSCEYKMCLFCYNTIIEGTGVCPGCRRKYEKQQTSGNSGDVSFQQRSGDPVTLSSSFQGLESDSD